MIINRCAASPLLPCIPTADSISQLNDYTGILDNRSAALSWRADIPATRPRTFVSSATALISILTVFIISYRKLDRDCLPALRSAPGVHCTRCQLPLLFMTLTFLPDCRSRLSLRIFQVREKQEGKSDRAPSRRHPSGDA